MNIKRALSLAVMTAALYFSAAQWGPAALAGSITYDVTVDTSGLSGTTGGVQFTLIAGNSPAPLDTASVSAFAPQAGLVPPATTSGDVTGDLTGTMSMDNQMPSLYFEALTYGSMLSFQVALSSVAGGAGAPDSTFSFYLFDQNGNPVSNSNSPSGEILDINVDGPSGAFSTVTYGPPSITVLASVPEPSSVVLLAVGLGAIVCLTRRRGQSFVDRYATACRRTG